LKEVLELDGVRGGDKDVEEVLFGVKLEGGDLLLPRLKLMGLGVYAKFKDISSWEIRHL
jgi:hypothetical protein